MSIILNSIKSNRQCAILKAIMTLSLLTFMFTISSAQNYKPIIRRIDSLAKIGLPKTALAEVEKLDVLAHKYNNSAQIINAALYRMTFRTGTDDRALSAAAYRLKLDIEKAGYPVKPVLQSVLASLYWNYYQQDRWRIAQRSHLAKPGLDLEKWDLQTIINESELLFKLSLAEGQREQQTPVKILDGVLYGDTANRYLRPSLYDLLLHRALDFFLQEEPAVVKPKLPFSLNDPRFFGDSQTFAHLVVNTTDTASTFYLGVRYLQQATLFHLSHNDNEALADLDLKRLDFLNRNANIINGDELYLNAIQHVAKDFIAKPISADALVLIGQYYQRKDSLKLAFYYFSKAASAYPKSIGGKNAVALLKDVQRKELTAQVENINIPGKPLLGLFTYRNVTAARMAIYKLSEGQYDKLSKVSNTNGRYRYVNSIQVSDSIFKYLDKITPVNSAALQLPDPHDYASHSAEFKIDALKPGMYVLITRDEHSGDSTLIQLAEFRVSNLSFQFRRNNDDQLEVHVVNREKGTAMADVQVSLGVNYNGKTDHNGICRFNVGNNFSFTTQLTIPGDTLSEGLKYSNIPNRPGTTVNTVLFTDRELYRPGQIIYFKGLQLRNEDGKSTIVTDQPLTVDCKDNNQKSINSLQVKTNEFGTFSGSFIIPQNLLNGLVDISTPNGSKYIRVEEYKRPNFQVEFLPVKNNYRLGDSILLNGTAMAYSGYGLSSGRVVYRITRQGIPLTDYHNTTRFYQHLSQSTVIVNDTVKTNEQGGFTIKFKALADNGIDLAKMNYRYTISADITDASGETRSASTSIMVSMNNIALSAFVPEKLKAEDNILASINNLDGVAQSGTLRLTIYSLNVPQWLFKDRLWTKPDQFLMNRADFEKDYSGYAYQNEDEQTKWPVKSQVLAATLKAGDGTPTSFKLEKLQEQPSGIYKICIKATNERGDTTSSVNYVYLINTPGKPQSFANWVIPLVTKVDSGAPAKFLVGVGEASHVLVERYTDKKILSSTLMSISGGDQQLITVPVEPGEKRVSVRFLMVYQNRLYTHDETIENAGSGDDYLRIKFLTFRDLLQPGQKEQWKLQVSGKNNERLTTEILAEMYDASLDALARGSDWRHYALDRDLYYNNWRFNWDEAFVNASNTMPLKYNNSFNAMQVRKYEMLATLGSSFYRTNAVHYYADTVVYRAAGYNVRNNQSINEVLKKMGGLEVDENGNLMAEGRPVTRARLNGKDFVGSTIAAAQKNLPADVLNSIQIVDDYGDQANKVTPITPRTNFSETAFFYPQLHTDSAGQILIDFTIPESLTKWRFRAFAHTKDLKTGYIEREIVTQKQLSVSANMPRFMREGDTLIVSARLSNLTASVLKGTVKLQLFNALTMQSVKLLVDPAEAQQGFELASATNKAVSFKLFIPAGIDALTYRITAESGSYSDGEENTLPVLPNRMLVTESIPVMVRAGQTRSYTFDKLINNHSNTLVNKTLTLEYTQNPAWYAVQALPYMMEYPYECSEQIFSRYYANSLATNLVTKMPVIKQVFDQWKSANSTELLSSLEKNPELKSTLLEETPWLQDAANETEQKRRIALLFDLNKMSYELKQNIDKLKDRQLADGGFPWFGGDRSDPYITRHILAGIGQLYRAGVVDLSDQTVKGIADKAMIYLDYVIQSDAAKAITKKTYEKRALSAEEIHAWYTESYYTGRVRAENMQALLSNYLNLAAKQWVTKPVYEQGLIALTMLRDKRPDVAQMIIRSLKETAQQTDDMGMYWPQNKAGYYWYQAPIETQSLMIELFTEAGNQQKAIGEMKIWLLRNKQTNNWQTTKATAAACYALLMKGDSLLAGSSTSTIKLNGTLWTDLKPDVKADAGTGYFKTSWTGAQVKPGLGKLEITNEGKSISWGAMYWQYTEQLDKITPSKTDIQLERKYLIEKQTDAGPVLTAVDAQHTPKTGDLLKVVVYLKAGRDFEYVQLKDLRPAGTEPVDVLSAYKYQDGLHYYQVTKDVATNFFISELAKGNYVFEYKLRVVQPGNYSTGISTVQSMYAPEFNAHSEGMRLSIAK